MSDIDCGYKGPEGLPKPPLPPGFTDFTEEMTPEYVKFLVDIKLEEYKRQNKPRSWTPARLLLPLFGIWVLLNYVVLHWFYIEGHKDVFAKLSVEQFSIALIAIVGLFCMSFAEALEGLRQD